MSVKASNKSFPVLDIDGTTIYAKPLPMEAALEWSEMANEVRARFANLPEDFGQLIPVMADLREVLVSYPALYSDKLCSKAVAGIDGAVSGQILDAIESLLEANDPFVWRQRKREAAQAKEAEQTAKILAAMPQSAVERLMAKQLPPEISSASESDSE